MTTSAQMVELLNREEAVIVGALVKALFDERTDAGAMLAWEELAGPEAGIWAIDWYRVWRAKRDREDAPQKPDIDPGAVISALPESLRGWAAGRLAAPVFADAADAKAALLLNLNLMRKRARR